MQRRGTVTAFALVAVFIVVGVPGVRAAPYPLAPVWLTNSDLSRGYALTELSVFDNTYKAKKTGLTKAQLVAHGRITGVRLQFRSKHLNKEAGLVQYDVSRYKTPVGAAWEYGQSWGPDLLVNFSARAPTIGQESMGFTKTFHKVELFGIDFREGRYSATIQVVGTLGVVRMSDAVKYGRIVNRRMKRNP